MEKNRKKWILFESQKKTRQDFRWCKSHNFGWVCYDLRDNMSSVGSCSEKQFLAAYSIKVDVVPGNLSSAVN